MIHHHSQPLPYAPFDRLLSLSPFTHSYLLHLDPTQPSPLDSALLYAPHMLEVEYGLGNVLFHTAEDVHQLAALLAAIPEDVVRRRFTGAIEHVGCQDRPTDVSYQLHQFRRLMAFYQQAAQHGQSVLVTIL